MGASDCFQLLPVASDCLRVGGTQEVGLQLAQHFQFSIFDLVEVPAELPPGEYTLSFRLDAEQTPQVWAHCSDIDVVD